MTGDFFSIVLLLLFAAAAVATVVTMAMHKELSWRAYLVVTVLGMCGWFLYPPQNTLKPGLDLAGGASLLYPVDVPEDQDADQVITQMIEVLRERVDPQGVRNLVWIAEAGNRIEIQMPRPDPRVERLRAAFDQTLENIEEANIPRRLILDTITADEAKYPERLNALLAYGSTIPSLPEDATPAEQAAHTATTDAMKQLITERRILIEQAREAQLALDAIQARYEAAQTEDEQIKLSEQVLDARNRVNQAVDQLLATNLNVSRLTRILELSDEPIRRRTATGQVTESPSLRARSLTDLANSHPARAFQIDRVVAAYEAYDSVKGPLDSPEDLKRLLRGAGVLEFRIVATPAEVPNRDALRAELERRGPRALDPATGFGWFKIDNPARYFNVAADEVDLVLSDPQGYFGQNVVGGTYGGDFYILLWDTLEKSLTARNGDWSLASANRSIDNTGFNAVGFNMNTLGARLMGELTGNNVGRQMAIVLDDRVYSAPNINSRIEGSGIITGGRGGFGEAEMTYLIRTLNAGALRGRLSEEPISERQIGATLGQDNLEKGLRSVVAAVILVCLFMLVYYFFAGAVANVALLANMVFILGVMAMFNGTFTLPGIAGIVLTIGMCVDANVLIFERIREEQRIGADIDTALRLGYQRAMSSIIDGNLTNLIVALILYKLASADVKGFGLTLAVGIAGTLFTSVFMTRVIFQIYSKVFGIKKLTSLPLAIPFIDRLLEPNWRLVSKRYLFWGISAVLIVVSIVGMITRGPSLFDIEFRGGTEVTFSLDADESTGEPLTMTLPEVRDRLTKLADWARVDFAPDQMPGEIYADVPAILEVTREEYERLFRDTAEAEEMTEEQIQETVRQATNLVQLADATVVTVGSTTIDLEASQFSVVTTMPHTNTVVGVIERIFADVMPEGGPIRFAGDQTEAGSFPSDKVFPVRESELGRQLGKTVYHDDEVSEFIGGAIILIEDMRPGITLEALESRIRRVRQQPDFASEQHQTFRLIGLEQAEGEDADHFSSVAMVVYDPDISYLQDVQRWENELAARHWQLVTVALGSDVNPGIGKVSNFTPSVAQTIQTQAGTALLLSLLAIIVYIWFRFGTARYGIAATIAVVHDAIIALGLVALAGVIYDTPIGAALLLGPFKINLGLIAALLTIIGYSLNDTIVLFDRIRENRGKLNYASEDVINLSINQTLSRTFLTSATTLIAVATMYIFGGEGIRSFAFCLGVGVIVGTYSTIAVASPILLIGSKLNRMVRSDPSETVSTKKLDLTQINHDPSTTTG